MSGDYETISEGRFYYERGYQKLMVTGDTTVMTVTLAMYVQVKYQ